MSSFIITRQTFNLRLAGCNLWFLTYVHPVQTVNHNPRKGEGQRRQERKADGKECMTFS